MDKNNGPSVRPRRSFIFSPGLRPDMFSKALVNTASLDNLDSIKELSRLSKRLSEGEIIKSQKPADIVKDVSARKAYFGEI